MGALDNLFGQLSEPGDPRLGLGTPDAPPQTPPILAPPEEESSTPNPLASILQELSPILRQTRESMSKLPQQREEELYKEKIRKMFGVKLGEKNSKWKSALRFLGEGLLDLGSVRAGAPTMREEARQRALQDYKLENEVLGKETTGILARLGQVAGQENTLEIARMKDATTRKIADLKASGMTPQGKAHLARAEAALADKDYKKAGVALRMAEAELIDARTQDIGKTSQIRNAEALQGNPGLFDSLIRFGEKDAAAKALGKGAGQAIFGGGGQGSVTETTRQVPNEATGFMRPETTISRRAPANPPNRTAAAQRLQALGFSVPGAEASPAAPTAPGAGPAVANAAPESATPSVVTPKVPRTPTKASQPIAQQEAKLDILPPEQLARMTPAAGKKYLELREYADTMKRINESIFGAGQKFDSRGQSVGERYSGVGGVILNFLDRLSGTQDTNTAFFKEANDQAFNLHRHFVTGAGAGWKELDFLKSRFPSWGRAWTADNFETSLQKALVLNYTMQKQMWNYENGKVPPEILGKIYNGDKMVARVDEILNKYKELRTKIPTAPKEMREKLVADFKTMLEKKLDGRDMFNDALAEAQGKMAGSSAASSTPKPKRTIRIEVGGK